MFSPKSFFKKALSLLSLLLLLSVQITGAPAASYAAAPTGQDLSDLAVEAYTYFYSILSMDVTRRQMVNLPAGKVPGFGPANEFGHMRAYPAADMKTVVRPNFDTLYSTAWLDLTQGPVVLTVPDTNGRYYLMPMLDMWSDVFASPGKRTTGTGAGNYLIAPQGWTGSVPEGMQLIVAPTPYVWIIGRTQTNGPEDYEAVHKVQDSYKLTPLAYWGKEVPAPVFKEDPSVDMKTPPLDQVNNMSGKDYFTYAAEVMKVNPPHVTDWSIIARLKNLGIEPGKSFQYDSLSADVQKAIDAAPRAGLELMKWKLPTIAKVTNGWSMNTDTMGVYGNYYLKRAMVAMLGLGANQPEDAIYPMNIVDAEGKPCDGNKNYVWHFEKDQLPPVGAFWSLTMYDEQGFQAANEINRFAVSSWMPFKYNEDGSLDLYIQNENPGKDKEANWLPAPKTALGMTMRLYWPKAQALDGRWNPPAIKEAK